MAIYSASCGSRSPPVIRLLVLRLSTAVSIPSSASSSPPPPSSSPSNSHCLNDHDPIKTLPLPKLSSTSTSGRFAVELAARRLSRIKFRESNPTVSHESFLSTVILSYGSAHKLDRAIAIFEEIPRLCSAPPTTLSFNALLSSAIRARQHTQVPHLFSLLSQKHKISPDRFSYGVLIKSLCLSGNVENALDIIKEMEEKCVEVTTVIYTTLISAFYKDGKRERAEELWNEMVEKGKDPDLTSYNVKIMHQALDGKVEQVLESISELKAAGLKPDRITYNYLMTCYSKNGRYEDVKQVYEELKSSGYAPNSTTFKVMMNLLCESGDFEAGFDVFMESMKHEKIPDSVTVRALVVGLAKKAKLEEAKMVIRAMRERFPVDMVGEWKIVGKELGLDI
ncbi:pentatricopeptide repeat-containing protein At4g36680, mitochondrial-like [Dendrobium catenatum]|uniref:Pentatricopeptide repeat-containing protein n=1 Tax=Dendrobium catenatum TaxID=906689 RepID=A0A2I0WKV5_9ASPA|nr:pentatricopeptide repeat-containing protein At4g36680, mitochondrial-like [Dendrobium catenatum]PKU76285.1 Pentatricopeptide repeat-containing protein [Dendrobium catenatum]